MNSNGALGGAHYGDSDIVVAKYDPAGNLMWATQLGTTGTDISYGGIWGDNQGNLYVAGRTTGSLGGTNAGGADAVLIKLSAPGGSMASSSQNSLNLLQSASSTSTNSSSRPGAELASATNIQPSTDVGHGLSLLLATHKSETSKDSAFQLSISAVDAAISQGIGEKWSNLSDEVLAPIS
jgi:hypothetical protein